MTKRNKTLKKSSGGANPYFDQDEYQNYRLGYDPSSRNTNIMSREKVYSNPKFNQDIISDNANPYADADGAQNNSTSVCSVCNSPSLNIFNLMKFFNIVRDSPTDTIDTIIEKIKKTSKGKDCKETQYCDKKGGLDEKKIMLCYLCNKKYIQRIYNQFTVDLIPTLYIPEVNSKWLKDVDFSQLDEQNKKMRYQSSKTLYVFIRFKNYNKILEDWSTGKDIYTIYLNNSKGDKDLTKDEDKYCKNAYIAGPCSLNDLLEAHFNNIVTIILNSYIAGTNFGQDTNNKFYDKLMYYCDVDENILLTSKTKISQGDQNYYDKIKNMLSEYLNIKKLNKMINEKLKNYYNLPSTNVSIFKKNKIKKPDIFIRLSSYKDKMTEKEYKNLENIMKKLEEMGILDKQRRLQEQKSKYFHTITINTLNVIHEDNIDDKKIKIRNYSPLNSFPELTNKEQIIYFTPEIMLYKSDLNTPLLFDTSRTIEDKNLIEIFLDPNKLATLLEYIPKTSSRYVPICEGAVKNGKCDTTDLVELLQKSESKQRSIIVNNINLILGLLFDNKTINLSLSFDNINKQTITSNLEVNKKKHYINKFDWNSSESKTDEDTDGMEPFDFKKKERGSDYSTHSYINKGIIESNDDNDKFVLKCYLDVNLELIAGEEPTEYKKVKVGCLSKKKK